MKSLSKILILGIVLFTLPVYGTEAKVEATADTKANEFRKQIKTAEDLLKEIDSLVSSPGKMDETQFRIAIRKFNTELGNLVQIKSILTQAKRPPSPSTTAVATIGVPNKDEVFAFQLGFVQILVRKSSLTSWGVPESFIKLNTITPDINYLTPEQSGILKGIADRLLALPHTELWIRSHSIDPILPLAGSSYEGSLYTQFTRALEKIKSSSSSNGG